MAESTSSVGATTTVTETEVTEPENRSLTIKLRKRKPSKKVEWSSDTVDNEHLGRRSSKCEHCHSLPLFLKILPPQLYFSECERNIQGALTEANSFFYIFLNHPFLQGCVHLDCWL
uniref:E3 ubiquitin-protein ligase PPP1R11 n=1 Tax=Laticauda laticaudata TaxID=8630 RepID=A0A8C5RNH9_LATLA